MEYIAVEGCTVKITPAYTPASGSVQLSAASTTNKIKGGSPAAMKGVYRGAVTVTVPAGTSGGYTYEGFTVVLNGNATTTKADNQFVLLEGVSADSTPQTGTQGSSTTSTTFKVEIEKAGQTKVKGT